MVYFYFLIPALYHLCADVIYPRIYGKDTSHIDAPVRRSNNNNGKSKDKKSMLSSPTHSFTSASTVSSFCSNAAATGGIIIGWCTATGTSKRMALLTAADAADNGLNVISCSCVSEIVLNPSLIKGEFFLLLFVATQGDGEAPSTWEIFKNKFQDDFDAYLRPTASTLNNNDNKVNKNSNGNDDEGDNENGNGETKKSIRCIGYHVVALGDSSYRHFAEAGKDAANWLHNMFNNNDNDVNKKTDDQSIATTSILIAPPAANTTFSDARIGAAQAEEVVEVAMNTLIENLAENYFKLHNHDLDGEFTDEVKLAQDGELQHHYHQDTASRKHREETVPSAGQKVLSCCLKNPETERVPKSSPFVAPSSIQPPSSDRPVELKVITSETKIMSETKNGAARDVVHLVFDSSPLTSRSAVLAGDHVGIYVANSVSLSERCADALNIPKDKWSWTLVLQSTVKASNRASAKEVLPAATSVIDALRYYPDLSGIPRRRLISKVVQNCCGDDKLKKDALMKKIDDLKMRKEESGNDVLTSVDILELGKEFLSQQEEAQVKTVASLSLEDFFFLCPRLLPRFFSVCDVTMTMANASSSPPQLSLLVALLPNGCFSEMVRRRLNFNPAKSKINCNDNNNIREIEEKERFFFFLRRTTFHPNLPSHSSFFTPTSSICHKPIIMIGAGTGVAPFIGFCHEIDDFLSGKQQLQLQNQRETQHQQFAAARKKKKNGAIPPVVHQKNKNEIDESNDENNSSSLSSSLNVALFYGFTTRQVGSPFLDYFHSISAIESTEKNSSEIATTTISKGRFLTIFEEAESRPHLRENKNAKNENDGNDTEAQEVTEPQRVQQRVIAQAELLAKWIIEQGAYIYICGRSGMAREVEVAIEKVVLVQGGKMNEENAAKYMQSQLRNSQRLRLDVWES